MTRVDRKQQEGAPTSGEHAVSFGVEAADQTLANRNQIS